MITRATASELFSRRATVAGPSLEPVYVDSLMACLMRNDWRWPKACHLFVDTRTDLEVLHKFAEEIGLRRKWFQNTSMPHYDLNESRRIEALRAGAIELNRHDAVQIIRRWKARGAAAKGMR